jgi:ABC-type transport system substrate-binding protein
VPGFRDERIYPLKGSNLDRARALARGHMRDGKAVLYAPNLPARVAPAQVLEKNLEALGLEVKLVLHPPALHGAKIATPGEPFDIADVGYAWPDQTILNQLFDGRTIGQPGFANFSYFNSPRYSRQLEEASRLTGTARERAYGELDVMLSRDAAPAIPFANLNAVAFVSARVGCVVMHPVLDPASSPQSTPRSPNCPSTTFF